MTLTKLGVFLANKGRIVAVEALVQVLVMAELSYIEDRDREGARECSSARHILEDLIHAGHKSDNQGSPR